MPFLFSVRESDKPDGHTRLSAAIGWLFVVVGISFFLWDTARFTRYNSMDFRNLFGGAVCLVDGHSPYRFEAMQASLSARGFSELTSETWNKTLPLYPPFTLILFTPLYFLSLANAATLFYLFTCIVCGVACYKAFLGSSALASTSPAARGFLLLVLLISPETRWAVNTGNPIVLCTGLLLICCFDVENAHRWLRAACFALAVLLKPQIALPMALPLLFKPGDGWRTLLRACAMVFLVGVISVLWAARRPETSAWAADLHANLVLGSSGGNTMSPTERSRAFDPRLNLSYLLGYWIASPNINTLLTASLLVVLACALLLGYKQLGRNRSAEEQWLLALAATSAFTLLPVYHRSYDAILLVLAVPWALASIAARKHRLAAWAGLFLVGSTCVTWAKYLPKSWVGEQGIQQPVSLTGFFAHRLDALVALVLAVVLASVFSQEGRRMQVLD